MLSSWKKIQPLLWFFLWWAIGSLMITASWYFIDPLKLRNFSAVPRMVITVLLGIAVGSAVVFIYRQLKKAPLKRLDWVIGVVVILMCCLGLLQPRPKAAPNRFNLTQLQIVATDAKNPAGGTGEVIVQEIMVGEKTFQLDYCSAEGKWEFQGKQKIIAPAQRPASLSCTVVVKNGTVLAVKLAKNVNGGAVEIYLDEKRVGQIDLYTNEAESVAETRVTVSGKYSEVFANSIWLADLLLIGFLTTAILILIKNAAIRYVKGSFWVQPRLSPADKWVCFQDGFNTWFDEATERFSQLVKVGLVLSGLLTIAMFLTPLYGAGTPKDFQLKPDAKRPNIIMIVVDALSAEDMSLYGYDLPTTPNLKRITRTWSVYNDAQSPLTCTIAMLPTMMTGRYPYSIHFNQYGTLVNREDGWINLASVLKNAGYQVFWEGYKTPGYYRLGAGYDELLCRSNPIRSYLDLTWFKSSAIIEGKHIYKPFIMQALDKSTVAGCSGLAYFTSQMDHVSANQPFFMYVHYVGVHGAPYKSGKFLGKFLPVKEGMVGKEEDTVYGSYSVDEQPLVDKLRLRYDESILYQDSEIGKFIAALDKKGLLDSSLVIITADHGQNFQGGYSSHCTPLMSYGETHVPLLVKVPGQKTGNRVDQTVSTVDIVPTILDIVGFQYPKDWFDGISLLSPDPDPERIVFASKFIYDLKFIPYYTFIGSKYRLLFTENRKFFYDNINDPTGQNDLYWGKGQIGKERVKFEKVLETYLERIQKVNSEP